MPTVYLGLGSNLGARARHLAEALRRLETPALRLTIISDVYETGPVGATEQPVPDYLNCVVRAETELSPHALLEHTQQVEREGGRTRSFRWGPRTIDVDILLYDHLVLESEELTIPHPRMAERAFVLAPLYEIEPGIHLPDGGSVADLLNGPAIHAQTIRRIGPALP